MMRLTFPPVDLKLDGVPLGKAGNYAHGDTRSPKARAAAAELKTRLESDLIKAKARRLVRG